MTFFRIKVGNEASKVVGGSDCTTLTVKIVGGSDFDPPQVSATAYVRASEKVVKRRDWSFPAVGKGETISIERIAEQRPHKPDGIGYGYGELLPDEEASMRTEITALRRHADRSKSELAKWLEQSDAEKRFYCSFCGKAQGEVRKLIAGPAVFICDECVGIAYEIATEGTSQS